MEKLTSDKEGVRILTDLLVQKGIKRVVLSPGSRNAPLLVAFARKAEMQHFVILDERSAAFFALGMAQQSGEPVALACTSGTALLNYAPAVAEAYYQRLPLIVLSADRPEEWVDQDDSQTIRQDGILHAVVKASYQLPAEINGEEQRWYANRLVNDAINCALKGRRGPVHINIPLHEPLYGMRAYPEESLRIVTHLEGADTLAPRVLDALVRGINTHRRVMILVGCHLPDERLKAALHRLAALDQVVILTETPANLNDEQHIGTIDRVLSTLQEAEKADFAPDLLITYGGPLISRYVKAFLRQYPPREHWSVDRSEHPADTFKALTAQIDVDPEVFFPLLCPQVGGNGSDYALRWRQKKQLAQRRHERFAATVPWCDWRAFALLFPRLPHSIALQLGNSTPVRYAQLFECPQLLRVDGNRGTSGIDGSTSTAVGAAQIHPGITLLITGDMSFLYDSNALWNPYVTPRLRIIVMKNGGGGIFRFIPGPSALPELEECFETAREVDVRGFAELHRFDYFYAPSAGELVRLLPDFFALSGRPAIMAIETPREVNAEVLKAYFKALNEETLN